jgi:hypothetical protein
MLVKRFLILLVAVAAARTAFAAEPPAGLQIRTTRPGANVTFEKSLAEGKALVSVQDAKQDPVLGLTDKDFTVARPDGGGKVVSVEPISKSVEVPRRVVLVLDNSFSMLERKAVAKLLEGVGAVLKHIRPIDDVRIVVFNDHGTAKVDGHNLRAEVFQSSKPADLSAFAAKAYEKKQITDSTYLYEAMLAGVDAIRGTPATDPRFLVVFSDGEDLNSAFKADVVSQAAQAVPNLHVYAIDYMPGPNLDHFLETFASQHGGQARKAGSGADLLSLFQNFASRMDDLYIVSFAFAPPAAGVTPKPAEPTAAPPAEAAAAPQPAATATLAPEATAVPLAATVPAAEPAAPEAQAKSNWWLWVILLIVVIIIVIFATRKSKEKEQQKR